MVHIDLLQLVVPEQLPIALVEQDVEGWVAGVSPPVRDSPLLAPKVCLAMVVADPHPLADLRFFGPHDDLPSTSPKAGLSAGTFWPRATACSQSIKGLPSGSRNIACVPLGVCVGANSKSIPLATSSSWIAWMSSVAT